MQLKPVVPASPRSSDLAALEHHDLFAGALQHRRGRETGRPRADDDRRHSGVIHPDAASVQVADSGLVVVRARTHGVGELVLAVRLPGTALLLEAAAERVVRVVVGRGELEHRSKLALGLLVAPDAEIRDPERLADRGLIGRAPLRLLERDGGLGRPAAPQMLASLLEKVVDLVLAHGALTVAGRARRAEGNAPAQGR